VIETTTSLPSFPLGDVCRTTSGGTPSRKRADYFEGDIPWVKSGELTDGLVSEVSEFITEEAVANSSAKLFPVGTLLIAMYGATVGKLGVLAKPAATNQAVCAIFPPPELDSKFLFWFLRFKRSYLIDQAVGGAQPNISQSILRELMVPVPPIDVQSETVAEIEKQFSRLDEAVANLHRVKANLKRYKASVLKAAVEGRLVETEASIAQREGRSYETGEQLLQRILEERRAKWTGRGKYKPPVQAPTDGHDVLPEGWTTATADQLAHLITSGSRGWGDFYSDTGVLFIRAQDIKTDTLNLHNAARVDVPIDAEGTRSSVSEGDILVTITGANVTKSALVPEMDELAFVSQHVALMKLTQPETAPFVFNWIISPANGRKTLESWAYGAGKPGLSLEQVRTLPIALPPLAEQIRVVAEIDRHLSIIRKVEAEVDTDFKRAQSLRQSVLSKVFLGSAA
jgi:type I restriction enzyme S subunit